MADTLLLLLLAIVGCSDAWEVCYYRKYYGLSTVYGSISCANSCCGYYYQRHCCYKMAGGAIAGAVIGGLVCLAVIGAVVVCIFLKNKRGARGTIVAPQPNVATIAVVQNQQQQQYGYQPTYTTQPMHHPPPPASGYPSYPPPPVTSGVQPAYPMAPPPAYPPGPSYPPMNQSFPPPGIPHKS